MTSSRLGQIDVRPRWLALALASVTFLLYLPTLRYDFVDYDDSLYVFKNQTVLDGLSLAGLGYAFTTVEGGSWMPLTWLSLMFDTTTFGTRPGGLHFTNIVLHAIAAAVLLIALSRMTGKLWLSALAAAAFALHPMRTESVAWIAERKDVLSGLWFVLGLLAYARYAAAPKASHFALVCGCLLLGLMSKPMLVTFPFVLLLLDFWPLQRMGAGWTEMRVRLWPLVREKAVLFGLVFAACAFTYWSQKETGALNRWSTNHWSQLGDIAVNYGFYLAKLAVPIGRTVIYPNIASSASLEVMVAVALVGVTGLVVCKAWRWPWLAVGWLWFVGMLVPVIGFVPVGMTTVADRYTYLPSIGLGIALVWSVAAMVRGRNVLEWTCVWGAVVLVVGWGALTVGDLPRWRSSLELFESAIKAAPHKVAYCNLAYYCIRQGDFDRAVALSALAIEFDPAWGPAYSSRAMAYACKDDYAQAKRDYDEGIRLGDKPLRPIADSNPEAIAETDPERRWEQFTTAIGLEPRTAEGFLLRAESRVKFQAAQLAIADYSKAIELNPALVAAFQGRATAFNVVGDVRAAVRDATQAIGLDPSHAGSYITRAVAYTRLGDYSAALEDNNQSIALAPTNVQAHQNRAVTHLLMRNFDLAWQDVARCRALGGEPQASFVQALVEASGRTNAAFR